MNALQSLIFILIGYKNLSRTIKKTSNKPTENISKRLRATTSFIANSISKLIEKHLILQKCTKIYFGMGGANILLSTWQIFQGIIVGNSILSGILY